MNTYLYEVKLTLTAPILTRVSGSRLHGLDTATLYADDQQQIMALMGSSIRGGLRHVWEYFASLSTALSQNSIDEWLGKPAADTDNEPQRAGLHFSYYWQSEKRAENHQVLHRIQIEADTGKVKKGALQVIEMPFASGDQVTFVGTIRAVLNDEEEAQQLNHWLNKGFQFLPALGGLKGIGFGKISQVKIEQRPEQEQDQTVAVDELSPQFMIAIKPQSPFCIAKHHIKNNRFEAKQHISGAVIKGCLGAIVGEKGRDKARYPELSTCFDDVRFSHAYPTKQTQQQRPQAMPLSLVVVKKQVKAKLKEQLQLYDVARKKQAGLIHKQAPKFAIDWKSDDWKLVPTTYTQAQLPRNIHIHTGIEDNAGHPISRAGDNQLFSIECIEPQDYHWLARIDCQCVPPDKQQQVVEQLKQVLSQGLFNLGKTKAYAEVSFHADDFKIDESQLIRDNQVIITLQSPVGLLKDFHKIPATNGGEQLQDFYQKAWAELSDNSLHLSHFYAQQRLVGGHYLYRRFWQHSKPAYNPELLTETGSVFVFDVVEGQQDTAKQKLQHWLQHGLQVDEEEDWRSNPYITTQGYGEIAVNQAIHWDKEPNGGWHELK